MRFGWNSTRVRFWYSNVFTNPFPPTVDFKTNATAPAESRNLCLLIASNVFSTRSFAEVAKAIDSNMSITSSFTAVAASFALNKGASVVLAEVLPPSASIEAELLSLEVELLPLIPPVLTSFTWRCWDRIGLLLLLSDETMRALVKSARKEMKKRDRRDISVLPAILQMVALFYSGSISGGTETVMLRSSFRILHG